MLLISNTTLSRKLCEKMRAPLLFILLFLSGCAMYDKQIQLSPQKTSGWKESFWEAKFQSQCNQGEVILYPPVVSHQSMGTLFLFIPIPVSKGELQKANEKGFKIYVEFLDTQPIKSCDLSYISLVEQSSGNQIVPQNATDLRYNGTTRGKYILGCGYEFDLGELAGDVYTVHISEALFNCKVNPIFLKKERRLVTSPM